MLVTTKLSESQELDQVSLARAQHGNESAFRVLLECYQKQVFSLLWRTLGSRGSSELVEDLAQETFLGVYRSLPRFKPSGPPRLST